MVVNVVHFIQDSKLSYSKIRVFKGLELYGKGFQSFLVVRLKILNLSNVEASYFEILRFLNPRFEAFKI